MEERFEVDRVVPKAKTEPQRVAAGNCSQTRLQVRLRGRDRDLTDQTRRLIRVRRGSPPGDAGDRPPISVRDASLRSHCVSDCVLLAAVDASTASRASRRSSSLLCALSSASVQESGSIAGSCSLSAECSLRYSSISCLG